MLKERLFGVSGPQGNHGEDVKELYYYLDSTPTHSYMKFLYKYPQKAYPYEDLVRENQHRGREVVEFEVLDSDVFDEDRYWDVFVEVRVTLRCKNKVSSMFFSSTRRTRIVQTTFTFASPHIIVVLTRLICISSLSFGSRTAGHGRSRLHPVLVCPPLQTTGSLPHTMSLERLTCTASHLLRLLRPTVKPSMPEWTVKKLQSSPNCYSPRTTRTSGACGECRINHILSRMHSTIISSRLIDYQAVSLSTGLPRPALTVGRTTEVVQIPVPPLTGALHQPQPHITNSLSIRIRSAPSLPRTTLSRMSLAEAAVLSCD